MHRVCEHVLCWTVNYSISLLCVPVLYLIWIGVIWLDQCVLPDLMFFITHEDAFTQVRTSARHHVMHALLVRRTAHDEPCTSSMPCHWCCVCRVD